ncbi:hypothetical protein Tco_1265666 [Tanacetum coccineum]
MSHQGSNLNSLRSCVKLTPFYKAFQFTADAPEFLYAKNKNTEDGQCDDYPRFTKLVVNFCHGKGPSNSRRNKINWALCQDDQCFTSINVISRTMKDTQLYGDYLASMHNQTRTAATLNHTKSIMLLLQEQFLQDKRSKKKADTDTTTKQKPPTAPKEKKEKKSGKGKQKTTELETISEAVLTEAEQLKIITKRSRKETHSSHASGSGADEGTGVTRGVPIEPDYGSEDDILGNQMTRIKMMRSSPWFKHQEIEDTHVTLLRNPLNVLCKAIGGAILHCTNQSPSKTPNPSHHSIRQLTNSDTGYYTDPCTEIFLNFASFVGFNYRLKALEDNFSELRQTNQYDEALSSSLASVDQYLEIKMQEAVDVAALVDAYEADKILLDTYGDTVTIKRPRDGADDDQEPSAGTDRGSKRRRSGKEPASTSAPSETTTTTAGKTTTTGSKTHKQSASQSALSVPAVHESVQPWLSNLAQRQDPRESFDELTDTTFDFSAFVMNRLNVQTLTPELLAGPTFELMKGTCKSLTELEYFCEEVYKATTEKLDWINPEGRQYPHDLRQPLPLVPNSQGRHVIPFHHFINNDLEYLRGGESSRKYSTSVTKTTAADYGHIKWIEDLVPNSMWSQMIVKYDKFALWGISHWGKKRRQFYAFATTRESARDVYSKRRIIAVTKVEIVEWQNYKHLDWITVRRDDDVLYKFKEGDFHRLRIQDIEDMLLLLVQGKVTNLNVEERIAFNVSLRMLQEELSSKGVSNLRRQDAYTPYSDPRGFIYENKDKKNRLMRIDELHKFSDGTLDDVRTALNDRLKGIRMSGLTKGKVKKIRGSLESLWVVDPHGSEGYLKMVMEVPDSSWLTRSIRPMLNTDDKLRHHESSNATLKLSKSSNQEWYEHVGPEVASPQEWTKFQDGEEIVLG